MLRDAGLIAIAVRRWLTTLGIAHEYGESMSTRSTRTLAIVFAAGSLAIALLVLTTGNHMIGATRAPPLDLGTDISGGVLDSPRRVWASEDLPPELREFLGPTPPAVQSLADLSDYDRETILTLVASDLLNSPEYEDSREFGRPGSRRAIIVVPSGFHLPPSYQPRVQGWETELQHREHSDNDESPRLIAISLTEFKPHREFEPWIDGHIEMAMFNCGGNPDGVIHIGALLAYYNLERHDGAWGVRCVGAWDF